MKKVTVRKQQVGQAVASTIKPTLDTMNATDLALHILDQIALEQSNQTGLVFWGQAEYERLNMVWAKKIEEIGLGEVKRLYRTGKMGGILPK